MNRPVWPPTILGKRKASFMDHYVRDPRAVQEQLTLGARSIIGHPNAVVVKQMSVESLNCDQCPTYVFPPSAEGFIWAMYVTSQVDRTRACFPKLGDNWTLKYACVQDMAAIDPHRKLVDWMPLHTSKEKCAPIRMIGTPPCLSAVQRDQFQSKLRNLDDAESAKEIDIKKSEDLNFASKLKSVISVAHDQLQEGLQPSVQHFLKEMSFRESGLKKAFMFDGARVAQASYNRLSSLEVLMDEEGEHPATAFTARLINQGIERELENLQTTTDEIRHATATLRQLTQLEIDHLESTRVLVEKQSKEMIQHLVEWTTKSETLMEEAMLTKVKLVTSSYQTEKKASLLQTFFSSGAIEIVEEASSPKDQALPEEAKPNQECCVCYERLEGFSIATSADVEKQHKRACFLPCMHANVCTTCSENRWNEGPRECPICRQPLTEKPRVLYL